MPFVGRTKGSIKAGLQTYANVMRRVPDEFRGEELEYLSLRDAYMNKLARYEQLAERLAQLKMGPADTDELREVGNLLHGVQASLQEMRKKVKDAGGDSYAAVYVWVSEQLLSQEVRAIIGKETERIIGRPAQELRGR